MAFKRTIHDVLVNDVSELPCKFWCHGEMDKTLLEEDVAAVSIEGLSIPLKFPVSEIQAKTLKAVSLKNKIVKRSLKN